MVTALSQDIGALSSGDLPTLSLRSFELTPPMSQQRDKLTSYKPNMTVSTVQLSPEVGPLGSHKGKRQSIRRTASKREPNSVIQGGRDSAEHDKTSEGFSITSLK